MSQSETDFAKDMLRGAEEIAEFLYGDPGCRRKVYHLVSTTNFPVFKLGAMICARRSVLLKWVEDQERRHANDNNSLAAKYVMAGKL